MSTTNGREQVFNEGIKNNDSRPADTTADFLVTIDADGTHGKIDPDVLLSNKEDLGFLENKQAVRDFYNNLYNYSLAPSSTFIGISAWGDSVSPETWAPFILALKSRYNIGCITYESAGSGLDGAPFVSSSGTIFNSAAAAINQSVYDGTGGFADFTYLPSANHKELSSGAVLTFSSGNRVTHATARAYFATGPGMGSVLVELLDEAGTTVVNSTTLNLSGASLGATKAQFSVVNTLKYRIRMTATGKVVFLIGGFFNASGITPLMLGRGGSTLAQNNYSNKTILSYLLSEFNVSLMFLQAKEENISVSLPATMTTFNTFSTTSKIIVGSAPDSSSPATQIANNALFRTAALTNSMAYYDAYKVMKDWAEVTRLGWNLDGTHINTKGTYYLGLVLQQSLDYFNQINSTEKRNINNLSNAGSVTTTSINIGSGDNSETPIVAIVNAGATAQKEIFIRNVRNIAFGDFSVESPIISAYSSTSLGVFNRASNALRDFRVRTLQSESITLLNAPSTSASGYDILTRSTSTGNVEKITLNKAAVGLSNVDNTSDVNKPVSTATQAALDLKAPLSSPELTGIPTAPTATTGTNTTQLATTAFVQDAVTASSADIQDIVDATTKTALIDGGNSQITMFDGSTDNRIFSGLVSDGSGTSSDFSFENTNAFIRNETPTSSGLIGVNSGLPRMLRTKAGQTTEIGIDDPIAGTTINFPGLPAGNHTVSVAKAYTYAGTSDKTSSDLTTDYPNALPGDKVYAMAVTSGPYVYEKTTTGWATILVSVP